MDSKIFIGNLFKKDINRNIQGVIQAGQQQDDIVFEELSEYVMTKEGTRRLEEFYEHYVSTLNKNTDKMGVWISGFFGSGKSHFLKILSYILGHKIANGKSAYSFFEEKTDNKYLLDLMKKVDESPSDAILFNVESKTTTNANDQEKILDVFLKVFNSYLGYSTTPWIADLERKLDEEGKYEDFKGEFREATDSSWEESRSKIALKRKVFADSLIRIGYDEDTARTFLDTIRQTFSIDSESFAKLVAAYCKSKGKDYRLIFLIDEIGQYIGGNTGLMLNLQTVIEDLGNYTKGQAWVIVTSQEKIDAVKGDDFSKIQGRFATRLLLSGSNADEVIKKRLLKKKGPEFDFLKAKYETQEQSIKNMLTFDNKSDRLISGYSTSDEFAESYPFVPYQFLLLQDVFEKVRIKGEAGKHLAYGERSLLNAFQEIAKKMQKEDTDRISIFAEFYDTIEKFLDSSVVKTINRSARTEISDFDVKVLKTLYMIKDLDYIKSSIENITTLFINNINSVRNNIQQEVVKALNHLESKMFIEKLADGTYRFLSDEEQEMNNEIKRIYIEDDKIKAKIANVLFGGIYSKTSIRVEGGYDFSFNRKFNDYGKGNAIYNITLQVYSSDIQESKAKMDSTTGNIVMLLPTNCEDYEEAFTYSEQLTQYSRKVSSNITSSQRKILDQKLEQTSEFDKKGQQALEKACKNARFYIQGKEFSYSGEVVNQIDKALEELIRNTFTKLYYINDNIPLKIAKQTILDYVKNGKVEQVDISGQRSNYLALEEVKEFLISSNSYEKKTVRDVINNFSGIPFGWNENDTLGLLALLINENKIKLKYLGENFNINHPQFIDRLMKIAEQEKIIVELEVEIPREIKNKITRVMKNLFSIFEVGETYDRIAQIIKDNVIEQMSNPIKVIKERQKKQNNNYPYPGNMLMMKLENEVEELKYITDPEQLVKELIEREETLEDWFDKLEDLNSFYNKTPIELFDNAVDFLINNKEEIAILSSRNSNIHNFKVNIESILKDEKSFNRIPETRISISNMKIEMDQEKENERINQRKYIDEVIHEIKSIEDFYSNVEGILDIIQEKKKPLLATIGGFDKLNSFATILATSSLLKSQLETFKKAIDDYVSNLNNQPEVKDPSGDTYKAKPKKEISISEILANIKMDEIEVDSLQKLDGYFNTLKEKLKNQLISVLKDNDLIIKK
ncbi:BREX system P-loop protein BrxC [Clostridium sp. DJ247]|uniref:BREX system P-loop protein BrxC n=1 Tax=Clostridium sp. DJ247 TaxID=2726188 RepID=UPI0016258236|nr:BREX system P-loop protein BrxC [Clostridium sp. DJ247]MBC2579372.1 BREX system P-loop protein BrxC [Clostridium sp. DJ247]